LHPVNIEEKVLGGARTQVITPKAGIAPENRARVLINLDGGGFIWGEGNGARVESMPIAGLGGITVVTVAYRMAPEFYGCSAGGILTACSSVSCRFPAPTATH
jgi:epsilon-lactone hydrolase